MTPQEAYDYVVNLPEIPPPTPSENTQQLQQQQQHDDEEPQTPSSGSGVQNDPPVHTGNVRYRSASVVINTDDNERRRKKRRWVVVEPTMTNVRDIAVIVLSFMLVVFAMAMVVLAYVQRREVGYFISILFLVFGFYVDKPKFGFERTKKKSILPSV